MPIDTPCPSCNRTLRVADEHAGKQARCPSCDHVYTIPSGEAARASSAAEAAPSLSDRPESVFAAEPVDHSQWSMKTPEGAVYGPVDRATLNRWLADGRIASDCHLSEGPSGAWRPAGEVFPQLLGQESPAASADAFNSYPGSPRASTVGYQGVVGNAHLRPHRGGLILVLGILGFFSCQLLGIMAWLMGSEDLKEMRAGRMDPSGEGMTQAGTVLGMLCALLLAISLVAGLLGLLFIAVIAAAN